METNLRNNSNGDSAPLFDSWRTAYCVTLGIFAIEIALFYVFTVVFA